MNEEFSKLARANGLRITTPRLLVFAALAESNTPLSTAELVAICKTADPASIYRTVELFSRLGIVSTVTRGWRPLYELAGPFAPHHHHMICSKCGESTEIQSEAIEGLIAHLADQHNFAVTHHHFELTGVCANCRIMTNE